MFKHSNELESGIPVDSLIHHIVGLVVVDHRHHRQVEGMVKDILNSHLEDCDGTQVSMPPIGDMGKGEWTYGYCWVGGG